MSARDDRGDRRDDETVVQPRQDRDDRDLRDDRRDTRDHDLGGLRDDRDRHDDDRYRDDRDLHDPALATVPVDREEATRRQKEAYGGVKVGSAFFGFLTATGMTVLLTALLAGAGAAIGVSTGTSLDQAANQATTGSGAQETVDQTVGLVGGIALLVVLLLAYYAGGYVAGRMARFNGARQGIAVWFWAVVVAGIVAVLAATAGQQYDILGRLNSFPRIPVADENVTTAGIIALVAVAVAALVGAVLGGLAGMRFHRKVDKAAFEPLVD